MVPWLEAPSPKKQTPTPFVPLQLGRQRRAADERPAAADDAVGAHHADRQVGHVHRAALAVADAGALAPDLGHHAVDVHALGDAVAVAAVSAGDAVVLAQVHADAGGRRFLAGVEVHEAGNVAAGKLGVQTLLELADRPHGAVRLEQPLAGQFGVQLDWLRLY